MELSVAKAKILQAFLEEPSSEQYGFGLMRSTGVKSGSLYPILETLERLGWLEGRPEDIDEQAAGRPRRRMYRLTAAGEREGRRAVAEFHRTLVSRPTWLPGYENM